MIRIAEAHAKLHLRPYVTDDDVNTATRIMLECFISTQKASVMKQMRQVVLSFNTPTCLFVYAQKFTRQLNYKRDVNDLLLYCLKQLISHRRYMDRCRRSDTNQAAAGNMVEIPEAELVEKARQMKIDDVQAFYKSRLFQANHFTYDSSARVIRQTV